VINCDRRIGVGNGVENVIGKVSIDGGGVLYCAVVFLEYGG
jgi:hypothetical protein